VALGGGTGLPTLLRGLKRAYVEGCSPDEQIDADAITAIATVTDDGGSSGRLRQEYQFMPPGDIRNCLLALADDTAVSMSALFEFRFPGHGGLGGHSLGNLILTALGHMEENFSVAVDRGASILGVRGRILPSTVEPATLSARFTDGSAVTGESAIRAARRRIDRVRLTPADAAALPAAVRAIEQADLVVIAPGSLYTSAIAVLLVEEIADAVVRSAARVALVMNIMTEPGETDGYTAVDHVLAVQRHAPGIRIADILMHEGFLPEPVIATYADARSIPVARDVDLLAAMGYGVRTFDFLAEAPKIRHDADKLARAVLQCAVDGGLAQRARGPRS
jgi:uncharacterized cofD-like protein